MIFVLKKLLHLLGFGLVFYGLSWMMQGWVNALILTMPIIGFIYTPFSIRTRHKEFPILLLMGVMAGLWIWVFFKFKPILMTILMFLHNMLSQLLNIVNEFAQTYFDMALFVLTSPVDNFHIWFNALWLYAMLVFKLGLKYLLFFVPDDSPLFLSNIAYVKHDDGFKVKKSWRFQRYALWFFVVLSLLLFIAHWQPFYTRYLDQWLTNDWTLYIPTLLIPIFIQWFLWLGGLPDHFQRPRFSDIPLGDPQASISFADLWERYQQAFVSVWRKAGNTMPGTVKDTASIMQTLHQQLDDSLGLIIQTYPNPEVLSVIQQLVHDTVEKGKHVVVLSDYDSNSRYIHRDWEVFFQSSSIAQQAGQDAIMSVSLFIDKLADKKCAPWVGKIGLILIPEGGQLFKRPYVWKLMAHAVRDHEAISDVTQLKSVVLAEPRNNFDTSIRNLLTFYSTTDSSNRVWREYRVPMFPKSQFWWTIWGADTQQAYLKGLSTNYAGSTIGPAVPLAQFAGQSGPTNVHNWLIYDHSHPEVENAEMLQQSAGVERCQFSLQERGIWGLIPDLKREPAILTTELIVNGNPWRTLASISQATSRPTLCNVVIKRHLLSDYFMDNEQTFALMTARLLSPNFYDDSRQDASLQILRRIEIAGELPLSKLKDALIATRDREAPFDSNLFQQLYHLIESSLGKHFADKIQMRFVPFWYKGKNRLHFEKRAVLSLTSGNLFSAHLDWLLEYEIRAEDDALLTKVRKDHVQQLYWAGKVIAVEGKKYKVSDIDDNTLVIKVNHNEMVQTADYRCQKRLTLSETQKRHTTQDEENALGNRFTCEIVLGQYRVSSEKVAQSTSAWLKDDAKIITLPKPLVRHYDAKRMLCFKHLDSTGNSLLTAGGAMALSAWLNEAISSIMPEVAPFFIAVAEVPENTRPNTPIAQTIIPQWSSPTSADENDISLWIIEDSHTDMGIIQAIEENYWYLLNSCYRWLAWNFADKSHSQQLRSNKQAENSTQNWFAYGRQKCDESIDLQALYEFLRLYEAKFNDIELHNHAEPVSFLVEHSNETVVCDFCSKDLTKEKQHTLSDGRITCTSCKKVAINDVAPINNYYEKLIKPFFSRQFDVSNFENVVIELVDQRTISAKQGEAFIPTAGFDIRAVGLAVYGLHSVSEHSNDSHTIYIESGFSLEETLTTLAHELCHIWQYMNLDIAKLHAGSGNLLIEGHAVFVESHFIKTQLEKTHRGLKKKQLRRLADKNAQRLVSNTVYGRGYRQLLQDVGGQPPFDWLLTHYRRRQ